MLKYPLSQAEEQGRVNTLRMLQRNARHIESETQREGFKMLNFLQGEMAIESVEQEMSKDWTAYLPNVYDDLLRYVRKREFWTPEHEIEFDTKAWFLSNFVCSIIDFVCLITKNKLMAIKINAKIETYFAIIPSLLSLISS